MIRNGEYGNKSLWYHNGNITQSVYLTVMWHAVASAFFITASVEKAGDVICVENSCKISETTKLTFAN